MNIKWKKLRAATKQESVWIFNKMELISKKNKIMLLPAFLAGFAAYFTYILLGVLPAVVVAIYEPELDIIIITLLLWASVMGHMLYILFLYLGLVSISKKISIRRYYDRLIFCFLVFVFVELMGSITLSIIDRKITFFTLGLIPAILTFVVPVIYRKK